ncbi:uncharacterized protein BP5553_01026 [Venustampulla echinocandica]|uniref:Fungal calcium binding protein domain-containing protein n=1 Tax=Venustampulla echinocandica TaxID=2656787 RepID=A0A370TZW5_9HELO|nr:uncharacterized protein BP5553_01026 [Venustampulla echinocandica]RDL41047.1 hypothetical protein BP5553_01026 [Venustampulla echinocandica]
MRFNLAVVATTLLGMSLATPTSLVARDTAVQNTDLILYVQGEALSPDVSLKCILNCASVILEAACIAAAIAEEAPAAIKLCTKIGKICGCADCIPKLGPFLNKHHLC